MLDSKPGNLAVSKCVLGGKQGVVTTWAGGVAHL